MVSLPEERRFERPARGQALLLWAGLIVAFSPVLIDLVDHMIETPWTRYAALFPLLFARCALNDPRAPEARRDGALLIAAGMGIELLGLLNAAARVGRLGFLLAAIGLCRRFALASGRCLLLLVLVVPLPSAAFRWTSPGLEAALLGAASGLLGTLGLGFEIDGTQAMHAAQSLVLEPSDSGLALLPLLAGLSWYRSDLLRTPVRTAGIRAAAAGLLAFPLQLAAVALALCALPFDAAESGRLALSHLPWMLVAAVSLARTEMLYRREETAHEH